MTRRIPKETGRLIIIAVAAIAFGLVMSLIKGTGAGVRLQFGNLSAPWLLVAFLAGARYRHIGAAAAAGALATIAALVGFYAEQSPIVSLSSSSLKFIENPGQMYAFIGSAHSIIYIGGLASGLLFGVLGSIWTARRSRLALGVVAFVFLMEPLALFGTGAMISGGEGTTDYWWMWLGEISVGVTLLATAARMHVNSPQRTD